MRSTRRGAHALTAHGQANCGIGAGRRYQELDKYNMRAAVGAVLHTHAGAAQTGDGATEAQPAAAAAGEASAGDADAGGEGAASAAGRDSDSDAEGGSEGLRLI